MTQHYELLMIFPVSLDEAKREAATNKIFDLISSNEGKVGEPDVWGNQQLAFEISHQTNGFYVLVEFDLDAEKIKKLDADMRLMPEMLRYLITRKQVKSEATLAKEKEIQQKIADRKSEEAKQEEEAKEKQIAEAAAEERKKEEAVKAAKKDAGKISLDDLDEKLDEILKEEV